jgi:hypothetical protein
MRQVAAWMQAGDLADGLGQHIGRTIGGIGGQGQQSRAELADEPRRAVTTAGASPVRGAEAIQHDGQAGGCDAGPVLILGLRAACLGGDGGGQGGERPGRGPSVAPGASGDDKSAADDAPTTL